MNKEIEHTEAGYLRGAKFSLSLMEKIASREFTVEEATDTLLAVIDQYENPLTGEKS